MGGEAAGVEGYVCGGEEGEAEVGCDDGEGESEELVRGRVVEMQSTRWPV